MNLISKKNKPILICSLSIFSISQITAVNAESILPSVLVSEHAPISSLIDSDVDKSDHTVNVLTSDLLDLFQPNKIEEVVTYLPNVQADRLGAGIGQDFTVRGFNLGGRLLVDGILDNQNYYIRDAATLERVEIIKGHDSVLYGSGSPGGSVNFVTKKPFYQNQHQVSLGVGSYDRKRLVLDSTGPIKQSSKTAYRSILAIQDADTWKDMQS